MRAEIRAGLARAPKELPPKYFYDARGSQLFEAITELPEYYLTRTERAILTQWIPRWLAPWRPQAFVELGAGSSEKSRIVLDAMATDRASILYVPVDLSGPALEELAARLRPDYPTLQVAPLVADLSTAFELPRTLPRPTLFAFLGSTIGNFDAPAAVELLRRVRAAMTDGDRFLLGADLKKDVATLEAAYNDAQGVTAEFNRNILHVLNRELGADFDPRAFEHRAFYSTAESRIEMHLVSIRAQRVTIPGVGTFAFERGESMRTEISCKYDRASVAALCAAADLVLEDWRTDPEDRFALAITSPRPGVGRAAS